MKFFRKGKKSENGETLFDIVLGRALGTLGKGKSEDLCRASLIGGSLGAEAILKLDPKLASLWGNGDLTKAARLLEVWTSTVLLSLLQNQPDQDAVCREVAVGLAEVVFDSDAEVGYQELWAYQRQREADAKLQEQGGIPTYAYTVLYLRCLRALGKDLDLRKIPIPIPSISGLMDTGLLDPQDNPDFGVIGGMHPLLAGSYQVARKGLESVK